jgi:DNA-binding HxlR family transcriptional regulator
MRIYGGFCPIAKAVEVLGDRWTLLIIRELLLGSHRFSELQQGLPKIPRSLLSQRLRWLEQAGVVQRCAEAKGRRVAYHLTPAGQDLFDVVWRLGEWGQRWVNHTIGPEDTDPQLLMWDMHRRVRVDQLPPRRVVAQFEFRGARQGSYWLVLERPEPSVCLKDPGFDIDLLVTADTVALHRVWVGHLSLADAMREGRVQVEGPSELVRAFPTWWALSMFAGVAPAAPRVVPQANRAVAS